MANVAPEDIAILVHPVFLENQDKICKVMSQLPNTELFPTGIWWYCEFPTNIRTTGFAQYGLMPCATIEDWRLRRIAGPSVPMGLTEALEAPVCDAA